MFKVGDKVKVKSISFNEYDMYNKSMEDLIGETGIIIGLGEDDVHVIIDTVLHWWIWKKDLELTDIKQFTKSDLQDTDIITYRCGTKEIWSEASFKDDVLQDLKDISDTDCDIIKVERPTALQTVFERE